MSWARGARVGQDGVALGPCVHLSLFVGCRRGVVPFLLSSSLSFLPSVVSTYLATHQRALKRSHGMERRKDMTNRSNAPTAVARAGEASRMGVGLMHARMRDQRKRTGKASHSYHHHSGFERAARSLVWVLHSNFVWSICWAAVVARRAPFRLSFGQPWTRWRILWTKWRIVNGWRS